MCYTQARNLHIRNKSLLVGSHKYYYYNFYMNLLDLHFYYGTNRCTLKCGPEKTKDRKIKEKTTLADLNFNFQNNKKGTASIRFSEDNAVVPLHF